MFIRKTVKRHRGRTYSTYLLVEAVRTPQGPRQKTICSLGDLSPGPRQKWLGLADRVEAALQGQVALEDLDPLVEGIVERIPLGRAGFGARCHVGAHRPGERGEGARGRTGARWASALAAVGPWGDPQRHRLVEAGVLAQRSDGAQSSGGAVLGARHARVGWAHGAE